MIFQGAQSERVHHAGRIQAFGQNVTSSSRLKVKTMLIAPRVRLYIIGGA